MTAKIGRYIRRYRLQKGITQTELGDKVGRTKSDISKWENELGVPSVNMVETLCEILEITPNQFFGWE